MKSFKQYITEGRSDIKAYLRSPTDWLSKPTKIGLIPGLINPSKEQLVGYLRRVPQARFILHNDQLHVFDANDAIHDDVLRAEHPEHQKDGRDFGTRMREMYDTKKSVLGSFHGYHDDNFSVGLSYVPHENGEWMHDLMRSHPRTNHLISPDTKIEPWDM